jgi:hypothetical protein
MQTTDVVGLFFVSRVHFSEDNAWVVFHPCASFGAAGECGLCVEVSEVSDSYM